MDKKITGDFFVHIIIEVFLKRHYDWPALQTPSTQTATFFEGREGERRAEVGRQGEREGERDRERKRDRETERQRKKQTERET